MSRSTIAVDYERQLIRHLQEDLNRRLNQVDGIIDRPEMAMIMFNIAMSMALGAQVFAATNVPELLNVLTSQFTEHAVRNREKVLRTAAAIRRGEKVDAAL